MLYPQSRTEPHLYDRKEFQLAQDSWIKIWAIYMTWFAWHFGIHVVAFGLLVSKRLDQRYVVLVWFWMVVLCGFGVGAAIGMGRYDRRVKLAMKAQGHDEGEWPVFGGPITRYACMATLFVNICIIAAWTTLALMLWKVGPAGRNLH